MLDRRRFLGVTAASLAAAGVPRVARARRPRTSVHFVLVHGSWHGAWCWYRVVAALESAGHRVTALDLPSAGIDGTPPAGVTLAAAADRVVAALDAAAEPVVLVGHSAGGPVISMAAEARPDRIAKLVYVTAYLLPSGVSSAATQLQDTGSAITGHLRLRADGTIDVERPARREIFYGECDDADVALAQSLLKPIGARTALDPVVIGDGFARVRRFYVTCLRDRAISPAAQRAMYTALPCERVLAIRSDHSPFFSHPSALVRALATIVRA
jgi:pimeloyl-ACP methyl ester carboxylesterase